MRELRAPPCSRESAASSRLSWHGSGLEPHRCDDASRDCPLGDCPLGDCPLGDCPLFALAGTSCRTRVVAAVGCCVSNCMLDANDRGMPRIRRVRAPLRAGGCVFGLSPGATFVGTRRLRVSECARHSAGATGWDGCWCHTRTASGFRPKHCHENPVAPTLGAPTQPRAPPPYAPPHTAPGRAGPER